MNAKQAIRVVLLACGLLLVAACSAQPGTNATTSAPAVASTATQANASTPGAAAQPPPAASTHFTDGNQYVTLKLPAGQAAPTGPVEIIEVFSYGCPHCAEFASYMDTLRTRLPKGVEVRYMPAVFSAAWLPYAQAFYGAKQLGVLKQTHDLTFKAMLEHYPLNSLADIANFYSRHGVDRDKFMAAAKSQATMRQLEADQHTEMGWGIDSTPTLVVGRRASDAKNAPFVALMRNANVTSYAELQQVGLWMVEHVDRQ